VIATTPGRCGRRLATLNARFTEAGLTKAPARNLSITLFCLLEGAFILARATREEFPVRTAGRSAAEAVRSALDQRTAQRASRRRPE
jgi:hypothetical protein